MGKMSEIGDGSVVEEERSPDFSGMTSEEISQYAYGVFQRPFLRSKTAAMRS